MYVEYRKAGSRFTHSLTGGEPGDDTVDLDDEQEAAKYLRDQSEEVYRYLGFYQSLRHREDRLAEACRMMDWPNRGYAAAFEQATNSFHAPEGDHQAPSFHEVPLYIASRALYASLKHDWRLIAADPKKVPQSIAIRIFEVYHAGEDKLVQSLYALDGADYGLARILLRQALEELNQTLRLLHSHSSGSVEFRDYRTAATAKIFDLRQLWLQALDETVTAIERERGF